MGIYAVKPRFRQLLHGFATRLAEAGTTPDRVTGAGLAFAALGGGAIAGGRWWPILWAAVPLMALGRITCNALDGLVAEIQGSGRPAGELFNETADRLGDLAFLLPVALVPGVPLALVLGAVAASQLASFIGVSSRAAGGTRRYDGPMGKPDRMLVLGIGALAALAVDPPGPAFGWAVGVIAFGGVATAANRYLRAHRELEAKRVAG